MFRRIAIILAVAIAIALAVAPSSSPEVEAASSLSAPKRVLDTRTGLGVPLGRVSTNEVRLRIPSVSVSGETAVLLNLAAVDADREGYVNAWPCDGDRPNTAVLNFAPDRAVSNMAVLEYTNAGICFAASSAVNIVADLTGVMTDGEVTGITPHRLVDTRTTRQYQANREYAIQVAGMPGIPANADGAALNVTVVRPSSVGRVIVKPCGSSSDAATINYQPNEVVPHLTFADLNGGRVCILATTSVDVVVDSFAWMSSSSEIQNLTPRRLLDTRTGQGGTFGAVRDGQVLRLRVAGEGGVPNDAEGATVNIAVTDIFDRGYIAIWPCHVDQPIAASLNMWPGMRRSNQATVQLSPAGELCLQPKIAGSSRIAIIVDAVGYVEGDVDRNPPPDTTLPPNPNGDGFETLPVGADLPSGAECAARLRSTPEIRPENAAANANRGSRSNANNRTDWPEFDRVDGDFAGTTDEIIQWAACKWGIDEDIARAQVIKESYWYQSTNGDNGESWGLGQVRDTAHQSAFEFSINARNSSAYNLDYTYASWRACYEGVYTWLNQFPRGRDYGPGDDWGCVGLWFTGRWYNGDDAYLNQPGDSVRWHYENRTWETPQFIDG